MTFCCHLGCMISTWGPDENVRVGGGDPFPTLVFQKTLKFFVCPLYGFQFINLQANLVFLQAYAATGAAPPGGPLFLLVYLLRLHVHCPGAVKKRRNGSLRRIIKHKILSRNTLGGNFIRLSLRKGGGFMGKSISTWVQESQPNVETEKCDKGLKGLLRYVGLLGEGGRGGQVV